MLDFLNINSAVQATKTVQNKERVVYRATRPTSMFTY